jgi:hypothetical protein
MYSVAGLIIQIHTATGYSCKFLQSDKPTLASFTALPVVFVDTTKVLRTDGFGSGRTTANDQLFAEDFKQMVEIHFCTTSEQKHTVWSNLWGAVAGWHEDAYEGVYSGLTYLEGGQAGMENGRIWWIDRWVIEFPRVYPEN